MILARRKFLTLGAATMIAAPAIVRASSLMGVKAIPQIAPLTFAFGTWSAKPLPAGYFYFGFRTSEIFLLNHDIGEWKRLA